MLRLEAGLHLPLEGSEAVLAHHLDGIAPDAGREAVGVVLHAPEQTPGGLVGISARCLAGPDPAAVEAHDEHREIAARVVELLGFLVAAREEGLVEAHRAPGVGTDERFDLTRDLLEARDEVRACPVRDEPSWLQRDLDRGLQRVSPSGSSRRHRSTPSSSAARGRCWVQLASAATCNCCSSVRPRCPASRVVVTGKPRARSIAASTTETSSSQYS